jgi:ethylbenzene dioxygenase ferredoxin component
LRSIRLPGLAAMSAGLVPLCAAAEVSEDEPRRVERDGFAYAVFAKGEEYFVTADECTHGPGLLSEGAVIGEEIECPFHQGRFDLRTGAPTFPPCYEPVRVWTAHVVDGTICIDPAEAR